MKRITKQFTFHTLANRNSKKEEENTTPPTTTINDGLDKLLLSFNPQNFLLIYLFTMLFLHCLPILLLFKCVSIVPFSLVFFFCSLFRVRKHKIRRWNNIVTRFKLCDLSAIFFSLKYRCEVFECNVPESSSSVRKTFPFSIQCLDLKVSLDGFSTWALLLLLIFLLLFF